MFNKAKIIAQKTGIKFGIGVKVGPKIRVKNFFNRNTLIEQSIKRTKLPNRIHKSILYLKCDRENWFAIKSK